MAVFTKLDEDQFKSVCENYSLGKFQSFSGIEEGVENTNYKLVTSQGKYILTIYEGRTSIEDLPFFMDLLHRLNAEDFSCPRPYKNKSGEVLGEINGKKLSVVSFLNGSGIKKIGNNETALAGAKLAEMHNITTSISPEEKYRRNHLAKDFWIKTLSSVQQLAEKEFKELGLNIETGLQLIENNWPENLPQAIIHADYFPDNVLYDKQAGKITGVIDFYMACNDLIAYDVAIAMNAWCFEKDNDFNITKAKKFLNSYNNIRKLSDEELNALPILCVGASLRFLSTRMYDYYNRKENALILVKNPLEYLEKLKFHLQIKNYSEYGIYN